MADDNTLPTAILPSRPRGIRRLYDDCAQAIGDPFVELFRLGFDRLLAPAERISALKEVISYRHAKPAKPAPAVNINTAGGGITMVWSKPPPLPPASTPTSQRASDAIVDASPDATHDDSPPLEELLR